MGVYLLGIDIGTSACKVAVFERDGHVLAQSNQPYQIYYPQPGWVEQDADEWWTAICAGIRAVLEKGAVAPGEIAGMVLTGRAGRQYRWTGTEMRLRARPSGWTPGRGIFAGR